EIERISFDFMNLTCFFQVIINLIDLLYHLFDLIYRLIVCVLFLILLRMTFFMIFILFSQGLNVFIQLYISKRHQKLISISHFDISEIFKRIRMREKSLAF